jgi:hypothetical protein
MDVASFCLGHYCAALSDETLAVADFFLPAVAPHPPLPPSFPSPAPFSLSLSFLFLFLFFLLFWFSFFSFYFILTFFLSYFPFLLSTSL